MENVIKCLVVVLLSSLGSMSWAEEPAYKPQSVPTHFPESADFEGKISYIDPSSYKIWASGSEFNVRRNVKITLLDKKSIFLFQIKTPMKAWMDFDPSGYVVKIWELPNEYKIGD